MIVRIAVNLSFVFCLALASLAQEKPLPKFEDYAVMEKFSGVPAKPKLATSYHRMFRTMIRTQTAKGPNFAGYLTVAFWGCGSGCINWTVVNAKTGEVYDLLEMQTLLVPPEQDEEPLQYKNDSRLLIVTGGKETASGRFADHTKCFYEWKNQKLVLIRKVKLQKNRL